MALGIIVSAFSQKSEVILTFTAGYNNTSEYLQLDSIRVTNISQVVDTVLFYPDTALVLEYAVGIPGNMKQVEGFRLIQNFPNPVMNQSMVIIFVPDGDYFDINVTDVRGVSLLRDNWQLQRGYHIFYFTPGDEGLLLFTATWRESISTIKYALMLLVNHRIHWHMEGLKAKDLT
jgi:hypothetical protein